MYSHLKKGILMTKQNKSTVTFFISNNTTHNFLCLVNCKQWNEAVIVCIGLGATAVMRANSAGRLLYEAIN